MSEILQSFADAGFDLTSVVSGGGLVTIVVLFATDRILTLGQHKRRVDDLTAANAREVADLKTYHEGRYTELKESRNYYREARLEEKARADAATSSLAESLELSRAAVHALTSLDQAARNVAP